MRKIIFSLVILLALLLAIEMGVTLLSEHGVKRVMCSQYGLPDNLKVSINSFPLTLSLIRNHLGEVRLFWEGDLWFMTSEGGENQASYYGQVAVYDVELNMPSLLRGRLDIRKISRIKTSIVLSEASLNQAFGFQSGTLKIEDGEIYASLNGMEIKYKVKVVDGSTISAEPVINSTNGGGTQQDAQDGIQTSAVLIKLYALPFDAALESITSEGNKLIISISIPMWEGYL